MVMKKKVLALLVTLAMLASLATVPAAAAGGKSFPDAEGHWAEESILRWSRCGLVKGDNLGNVNPNMPLRRCEMATILSDMLGLRATAPISTFRDIDGTEWYARAILRCAAAGIMEGSNSMSYPLDNITREEAIVMFARALGVQANDDPDLSEFTDGDKVSGWAAPYVDTLVELGILSGMGDGTLAPHDAINRAGTFTLMDKAVSVYANAPGTYHSQNENGFVVVNSNAHQDGDVIVTGKAAGVLVAVGATNPVKLRNLEADNVIVNGKSDVTVTGNSNLAALAVNQALNLTVEADAKVGDLAVKAEGTDLTNAGTVETLTCGEVATVTNSGKVGALVADAAADITNTGTVDQLVANAAITVDNTKGTVKSAEINMGGVVMDGPPQTMTVADGVARPSNSSGRPITASGAVSSGGSSGGGGGSSRPSVSVTGVTLDVTGWVMNVGDTKTLTATVVPSNASNKSVTWTSSDEAVATVTNGTVTAVAEGTATITVKTANGGKTATCDITVRPEGSTDPIPVKSVAFDKAALELEEGSGDTLKLILDPANATVDGDPVWASGDETVVTVDQTGKVTAVAPGTAEITATVTVTTPEEPAPEQPDPEEPSEGGETTDPEGGAETQADKVETFTAKCAVTVKAKPVETVAVTGVTLDEAALELEAGKAITLTATVAPADATNKTVTWTSSDEAVATVKNGTITAVAEGTATVTVTTEDGNFTATCAVTVKAAEDPGPGVVEVESVTIGGKPTETVKVGDTFTLTAAVLPENATDKTVTWASSDENIATVVDGEVTALAAGTTTITATAGGKTDTYELTVEAADEPAPETPTVALDQTALTLTLKDEGVVTAQLAATVTNAEGATVVWSSDAESVATVDQSGLVTALTAGTANIKAAITVDETEYSATCTVTVNEEVVQVPTITEVTLDQTGPVELTVSADENGSVTITATIVMSDDSAPTETVTWTVEGNEDGIVTTAVDETDGNGNKITVTAAKAGSVTVKATAGDKSASCAITVTEVVQPAVVTVELDAQTLDMKVGDAENGSKTLTATVKVDGKADGSKTVTWTVTGDEGVVTVTGEDTNAITITAAQAGTATITATCEEQTATCTITVAAADTSTEPGGEETPAE